MEFLSFCMPTSNAWEDVSHLRNFGQFHRWRLPLQGSFHWSGSYYEWSWISFHTVNDGSYLFLCDIFLLHILKLWAFSLFLIKRYTLCVCDISCKYFLWDHHSFSLLIAPSSFSIISKLQCFINYFMCIAIQSWNLIKTCPEFLIKTSANAHLHFAH